MHSFVLLLPTPTLPNHHSHFILPSPFNSCVTLIFWGFTVEHTFCVYSSKFYQISLCGTIKGFTKSSFISFKHAVSKILCTSQRYSNYVNSQLPPINQIPLDAHARQSHDFRWHVNTLGAVNSSETWSVRRVCTQSWYSTKSKFCLNSVFFF